MSEKYYEMEYIEVVEVLVTFNLWLCYVNLYKKKGILYSLMDQKDREKEGRYIENLCMKGFEGFIYCFFINNVGKRKYGATSAKRRKFWATSCCGLWDLGMQLDSLTSFVKIVLFCHIPFSSLSALSIFFAFLHITFQLFSPTYSWSNLLPKYYLLYLTLENPFHSHLSLHLD